MNLIFNGGNFPYQVNVETGKITQPPEKCYHCDNIKKASEGCSLADCDKKDIE